MAADVAEPTASSSAEKQKFAKTRFVANAGLAAGATYQWIVKPYRKGKFKKGAKGRKLALVKAGVAGAFAYNRLKAAVEERQGRPAALQGRRPAHGGHRNAEGACRPSCARARRATRRQLLRRRHQPVKEAGKSAGAEVKDKVPSAKELSSGS